ncbi:uncharacterized protein LOC117240875 [Bombus vosnesenskii]|uniref:Uncharacterized protein LOC117240875 n=1 Tax=Bombus vosnesenskii TaxID=207650 RepID=A0A6J3LFX3_9HYME|nr:uncharacterized protein LOC117240875 [Bombus vosnesenskii]
MMLYYIALAIICMCDEFFNMAARVSLWYGVGLMSTILLFRCCVTYLDRSHNIIRFFDMPWILTTAAFYYGCLPSYVRMCDRYWALQNNITILRRLMHNKISFYSGYIYY